jgi:hypothetical protein
MASELDGLSAALSSIRDQQQTAAEYIATLIRLLADSGAISRTSSPFANLINRMDTCPWCGMVH